MKKLIALLLVLVMVLGLVACGAKEEPKTEEKKEETSAPATEEKKEEAPATEEKKEEAPATESKTVTIMWPETDSTQVGVMEALQPALAEKFPEVTFEFVGLTFGTPAVAIWTLCWQLVIASIWLSMWMLLGSKRTTTTPA